MPHRIPRHYWRKVRLALRRIVQADASPHAIALGTAIGVFVAFTPTVGIQMILGAVLATIVRANRLAAVLPAWISNPLTIPPIFLFNYSIGRIFIQAPDLVRFQEHLDRSMEIFRTEGLLASIRDSLTVSGDILEALWVGSVLVATVLAVPTYGVMRYAVTRVRARKQARREGRAPDENAHGPDASPPLNGSVEAPADDQGVDSDRFRRGPE